MQDSRNPSSTGGVDMRLLTNNGVWGVAGQAIFSRNDNQDIGYGITGEIMKAAGKHFRGSFGGTVKNPELHINRLGFTPRSDLKHGYFWMQYRTRDDIWFIRNSWTNLNFYSDFTLLIILIIKIISISINIFLAQILIIFEFFFFLLPFSLS